jgi:hypothetical protein
MSVHESWLEVIEKLRAATGKMTGEQKKLAEFAGVTLRNDLPRVVAAARLRRALAEQLGVSPCPPASEAQIDLLSQLDSGIARTARVLADSEEAAAWIQIGLLKRRINALEKLKLESGDIVVTADGVEEVRSISSNGRIHFKGGRGAGAWPDRVTVQCRKNDADSKARDFRRVAANRASSRQDSESWSTAKERELAEFRITARLNREDVLEFKRTVDAARDERSIQEFLETHPQVLGALLSGRNRFVLPRPSLGGKRIPDFLLSDVDSLGIRWLFIELETPKSRVTLKNENNLDRYAKKGLSQIGEWREWIQDNLDSARRPRVTEWSRSGRCASPE